MNVSFGDFHFGTTGFVAVQDGQGRDLYRQAVHSEEEAKEWIQANQLSARGWDWIESSFAVVRTDNLSDFCEDFFLPTFVNRALKIEALAWRVIAGIFAIAWDAITLGLRVITLPIRMYAVQNSSFRPPVQDLIETSPYFEEAMRSGSVSLLAHVETRSPKETVGEYFNPVPEGLIPLLAMPCRAAQCSYDAVYEVFLKAMPRMQKDAQWSNLTDPFVLDFVAHQWCRGPRTGTSATSSLQLV